MGLPPPLLGVMEELDLPPVSVVSATWEAQSICTSTVPTFPSTSPPRKADGSYMAIAGRTLEFT